MQCLKNWTSIILDVDIISLLNLLKHSTPHNNFGNEDWCRICFYETSHCDLNQSPFSYLKNEHICGRPLGEDSGRVLKYNPKTKETTVLVRNLQFPNGLSLSKDGSFFVFYESSIGRLRSYWVEGYKVGTTKVMAVQPGFPDNIRTNDKGEFWMAIHCRRTFYTHVSAYYPKVRKFILKLPISARIQYLMQIGGRLHAMVVKFIPHGELFKVLKDRPGKVVRAASEVDEKDWKFWMGSVLVPFIAAYQLQD
ncbi:hypothetical protein LIER_39549 [Lithospermum erythrorhizon]|uniref:Strictosidine synthase conserved region domain-containing protein n=1 Tax=Lithospermum erythrorhizon TaxID=34254 RepID=A0AAV3QJ85_LITER